MLALARGSFLQDDLLQCYERTVSMMNAQLTPNAYVDGVRRRGELKVHEALADGVESGVLPMLMVEYGLVVLLLFHDGRINADTFLRHTHRTYWEHFAAVVHRGHVAGFSPGVRSSRGGSGDGAVVARYLFRHRGGQPDRSPARPGRRRPEPLTAPDLPRCRLRQPPAGRKPLYPLWPRGGTGAGLREVDPAETTASTNATTPQPAPSMATHQYSDTPAQFHRKDPS
ncbi:hypothetical protein GCM10010231_65200 [Streptomyces sindenensis]|nr:hypothetical protein GCM10010231_65200 [Streptomyces sindenensis]